MWAEGERRKKGRKLKSVFKFKFSEKARKIWRNPSPGLNITLGPILHLIFVIVTVIVIMYISNVYLLVLPKPTG